MSWSCGVCGAKWPQAVSRCSACDMDEIRALQGHIQRIGELATDLLVAVQPWQLQPAPVRSAATRLTVALASVPDFNPEPQPRADAETALTTAEDGTSHSPGPHVGAAATAENVAPKRPPSEPEPKPAHEQTAAMGAAPSHETAEPAERSAPGSAPVGGFIDRPNLDEARYDLRTDCWVLTDTKFRSACPHGDICTGCDAAGFCGRGRLAPLPDCGGS